MNTFPELSMDKTVLTSQGRTAITRLWGHDPMCSCHSQAADLCKGKKKSREVTQVPNPSFRFTKTYVTEHTSPNTILLFLKPPDYG